MPDVIKWKEIGDKKVLMIDLKGLKGEALVAAVEKTERFFLETPPDKKQFLPVLVDVTGAVIDTKVMSKFKGMTKNIKGYKHKAAVLGVTAAKTVLLNAINFIMPQESKPFDDENGAVQWLFKP
jgi:hypothetical protein